MTAVKKQLLWASQYRLSVQISIERYNYLNRFQPVYTRQLDEYEMGQIFGDNPDYIKNIGRKIDGKEWKELTNEKANKSSIN